MVNVSAATKSAAPARRTRPSVLSAPAPFVLVGESVVTEEVSVTVVVLSFEDVFTIDFVEAEPKPELVVADSTGDVEPPLSEVDEGKLRAPESALERLSTSELEMVSASEALEEALVEVEDSEEVEVEAEAVSDTDLEALADVEAVEDAPAVLSPYAGAAPAVSPTIEPLPQSMV